MTEAEHDASRRISNPAELTCREVVGAAGDYLDESLAAPDRTRIEQHLLLCVHCLNYLDQYRDTVALTAMLATAAASDEVPPPAPTPAPDRVLALFRARKPGGAPGGTP